MEKILITGAFGLVGSDLAAELAQRHGNDALIVVQHSKVAPDCPYKVVVADVRDKSSLEEVIRNNNVTTIYHLAGLLSVGSEKDPQMAWEVNLGGLKNILDLSVQYSCKVFWPSSIAAFGPTTPKNDVPQHTVLEPTTMYGVNKVAGELLCQYYNLKYGLDVRSLRYPGLLGWKTEPGNGTTEYALWMMYAAVQGKKYECYLRADSRLPMMHMDDAIKGTLQLMDAKASEISIRTSYNFSAISFTPEELVAEIQKYIPTFTVEYKPDERQKIADSWPQTITDSVAQKDWHWKPALLLSELVKDMLVHIAKKIKS